jgi:acid stress-induced BolA-like protein IbaG/YrbA
MLSSDDLKNSIQEMIKTDTVLIESDGSHFLLTIVSDEFEGLSKIKRQQKVYACLNEYISNGSMHAVSMKTYTPVEWSDQERL